MNRSATSRELLRKTASEIARREGIGKLNIRRVAADSKIAIGTVYNYFPSKADLIAEVMEDFWRNVFHGSQFHTESDEFLESFLEIYARFRDNLQRFRQEFLQDMELLTREETGKGRPIRAVDLAHIKQGLRAILDRDKRISEDVWYGSMTKEVLIDFVFEQMGLLLGEPERDVLFLEEILKRLLYRDSEVSCTVKLGG